MSLGWPSDLIPRIVAEHLAIVMARGGVGHFIRRQEQALDAEQRLDEASK